MSFTGGRCPRCDELAELLPPERRDEEWRALRPALAFSVEVEREHRRAAACAAYHRASAERWGSRNGPFLTWAISVLGSTTIGSLAGGDAAVHGTLVVVASWLLGGIGVAGVIVHRRRDRAHSRAACVL